MLRTRQSLPLVRSRSGARVHARREPRAAGVTDVRHRVGYRQALRGE
jgi:hypothetical protein